MIIKKLILNNFQKFSGTRTFTFKRLNLIKGKNGTGKSTLSLSAILFCLQGYTGDKTLAEIPTRNVTDKCSVEIDIEQKGINYRIIREYPTKITIYENDVLIDLANNTLKQDYITSRFKDTEYFRKFRIIDNTFGKRGSNFLDEGKTTLNKLLLSLSQDAFNNIRQRLNEKKSERVKYNRDLFNVYPYFPSIKRLEILKKGIDEVTARLNETEKELRNINQGKINLISETAKYSVGIDIHEKQIEKLMRYSTCPTCFQTISNEYKRSTVADLENKISNLHAELVRIDNEIKTENEVENHFTDIKADIYAHKERLLKLRYSLEDRLKQRAFIYNDADVMIVKKTIEELDRFYAYYITQWIKVLEPIINSVIEKIGYKLEFQLDEKQSFDIKLYKDNIEWSYSDLSNGQKTILSIAFKMSLLLEQNDEGLIIADEGFGSLDEDNLEHIFQLFTSLPFQLICILHRFDSSLDEMNTIELE